MRFFTSVLTTKTVYDNHWHTITHPKHIIFTGYLTRNVKNNLSAGVMHIPWERHRKIILAVIVLTNKIKGECLSRGF